MSAAKRKPAPVAFTMDAADFLRGLHNARLFTSPDVLLTVLRAVYIEGGKGSVSFKGTDRYTVGVTTIPATVKPFTFLMRNDDVALLLRLFTAKSGALSIVVTDEAMTVEPAETLTAPQVVVTCPREPGEFPKLDNVLDGKSHKVGDPYAAGDEVAMNPRYIAKFARVKSDLPVVDSPLQLRVNGTSRPILAQVGEQFVGAIMPVRIPAERKAARVEPKESAA